jgi:hypothetical protein
MPLMPASESLHSASVIVIFLEEEKKGLGYWLRSTCLILRKLTVRLVCETETQSLHQYVLASTKSSVTPQKRGHHTPIHHGRCR